MCLFEKCIDDMIEEDNIIRFIDNYIEALDNGMFTFFCDTTGKHHFICNSGWGKPLDWQYSLCVVYFLAASIGRAVCFLKQNFWSFVWRFFLQIPYIFCHSIIVITFGDAILKYLWSGKDPLWLIIIMGIIETIYFIAVLFIPPGFLLTEEGAESGSRAQGAV